MLQAKIDAIMDQVEERAILAIRPYPPVNLPDVRSQLGGLPTLSAETDWPRASDGIPLHFLARVDCSELPPPCWALPDTGTLQFFARIDEEMVWDGPASDHARVLYSSSPIGRTASPPADLPPIEGGHHTYDRDMRLPDEPHTRIYPQWPLTFKSIRSWPIRPPIDPSSGVTWDAYREAVDRARAAEIVRTTGRPTNPLRQAQWGDYLFNREGKRNVILSQQIQSAEFPQAWILAERIARAIACLASEEIAKLSKALERGRSPSSGVNPEQLSVDFGVVAQQAVSWVRRAQSAGLGTSINKAEAKEYSDWLERLGRDDRFEISYLLSRSLKRGMSAAIKYCGGSREAAKLVPAGYMNHLEGEHTVTSPDTFAIEVSAPRRRISASHHQLLGHAPTSQDIGRRTKKDLLLLHLVSDRGVDFLFCDCGEVQFWIDADDLAARKFDRVKANTEGG